jgi:lysophospholipase L1-like esterase
MGRRRPRELAFALVAALLCLVAVEAAVRAFRIGREPYDDFYDDIYDLSYAMVPGASNPYSSIRESLNQFGFRGAAVSVAKPAGTYRIVVLGDSCTFGFGVAAGEAWPAVLERLLNESGKFVPVQVINGATPGTNLFQHVIVLRKKLAAFRPDLVIDWSGPNYNASVKIFRDRMADPPFYVALQRPLRRLALYRLFQRAIKKGPTEKAFYEYYFVPREAQADEALRSNDSVYLRDYRADLEDLWSLSREYGFDLMMTNYPATWNILDVSTAPPRYGMAHLLTLSTFCARHRVPLLDLIGPQRAVAAPDLFLDAAHPTARGHALIAGIVRDAIVSGGTLPRARGGV